MPVGQAKRHEAPALAAISFISGMGAAGIDCADAAMTGGNSTYCVLDLVTLGSGAGGKVAKAFGVSEWGVKAIDGAGSAFGISVGAAGNAASWAQWVPGCGSSE